MQSAADTQPAAVERALTVTLEETYREAGELTGYWGRRFLQALRRNGGLATAQRMLKPRNASQRAGLDAILAAGHPELTLEAVVLRSSFRSLFTAAELAIAGERLANDLAERANTDRVAVKSKKTNWSRDELILALDLYMAHRTSPPVKNSASIISLSKLLGSMGRAEGHRQVENYRNANGVYMKLMNFRSLDPLYTGDGKVGLAKGGKEEKVVWSLFAEFPERLQATAKAIRAALEEHAAGRQILDPEEPDIEEAEEGQILTRVHRTRERSRKLVEAAKKRTMKKYGRLSCAACRFDFGDTYGDAHLNIIDCHHTKPIHAMEVGAKTHIDDLVLLCANCHRAVHAIRPWLTLPQLISKLQSNSSSGI